MSSLDSDDDGTVDDGTEAAPGAERTPWEIQEVVAVALLTGIAAVAVTGVALGTIGAPGVSGQFFKQPAGQALIESTQWAGLLTAFVLVCATALVWWQVDGWTEVLDDLADNGTSAEGGGSIALEIDEAQRHVRRNRRLATWARASLVITAMAAVALVIGVVIQQTPVEPSALDWDEILSFGGQSLASVILAAAGLYGASLVRKRCDDALMPPPAAASGEAAARSR